jgi:hypothetical protein
MPALATTDCPTTDTVATPEREEKPPHGEVLAHSKRFRKEVFRALMQLGGSGSIGEISLYLRMPEITCAQLRSGINSLLEENFLRQESLSPSSGPIYRFNS